jgi:UDP-N-acetylmuramoyl-tripeptide--D-alanyl-D-alanine ligase
MKELGDHAPEGHRMVRDVARECGLECWVVGKDFSQYAPSDRTFEDMSSLETALELEKPKGRTILLKGSRSMRMEGLVDML